MEQKSFSNEDKADLIEYLEPENIISKSSPHEPDIKEFLDYLYEDILKGDYLDAIKALIAEVATKYNYSQAMVEHMIKLVDREFAKLGVANEVMVLASQKSRQIVIDAFKHFQPQMDQNVISPKEVAFYLAHGLISGNAPVDEVIHILQEAGLLEE